MTLHVDDMAVAASKRWLDTIYAVLEQRFGKCKRQVLPFVHMGILYEKIGHPPMLRCMQHTHIKAIKKVEVPKGLRDDLPLSPSLLTAFRGILTSLLYDTQTRPELACEITILQNNASETNISIKYDKTKYLVDNIYRDGTVKSRFFPLLMSSCFDSL